MNQIRAIQALNKREIENGVSPEASWHTDYRDTAFINFGGLPYELTEGDIITIFSQYGEPVFLKLARDKETGKSKGFGWLKYEDQRSCDLAVDNLGGTEIAGRLVRVDHARYKARDDEDPDEFAVGWADLLGKEKGTNGGSTGMEVDDNDDEDEVMVEPETKRPMIKQEIELQKLIQEHDDDDPMKGFLIEEKKREIEEALRKEKAQKDKKDRKHRHYRSRRVDGEDREREHRHSGRSKRRDTTPVLDHGGSRNGGQAPERRRDRSKERDHEERKRGDDDDRHHARERHRDREDKHRHYGRDHGAADGQTRQHKDEARDRDRDRDRSGKGRRRSRSRSRNRNRTRSPISN